MKRFFSPKLLPAVPLCAGVLALVLRLVLYTNGVDEKGLLIAAHPLYPACFLLAVPVIAIIFLCSRNVHCSQKYVKRFPQSPVAALGCIAAAVGIFLTVARVVSVQQGMLEVILFVLGVLTAGGLAFAGICRAKNKRPNFLIYALFAVFLMLRPLEQYRLWTSDPQLQNYFFHLMASVFLMLAAYQRSAMELYPQAGGWYAFCSQTALFFCCISIHGDNWLYYLTMAIWAATNLCAATEPSFEIETDAETEAYADSEPCVEPVPESREEL